MDCRWIIGGVRWPVMEARWQTDRAGKPAQMKLTIPKEQPRSEIGEPVRMEDGGESRFEGYVFSVEEGPTHREILAYDQKRYLMYRDTILIQGKTADQIVTMLAGDMGLTLGRVASTGVSMDLAIVDKKLIDIIEQALVITEEKSGRRFVLCDQGGKLCLVEEGDLRSGILLREESALMDYRAGESIDGDTYNVVKLAQKNRKKGVRTVCVVEDGASAARWGRLQYYGRMDEKMSEGEIRAQAAAILAQKNRAMHSLTLRSLGDTRCFAGAEIDWELDEQRDAGIIVHAVHHWKGARYTMTLDVESYRWGET